MHFLEYTLLGLSLSTASLAGIAKRQNAPTVPTANVRNGTITGRYMPAYDEDYFLGIPFAQPPVGPLRFHTPIPLNESWSGSRNATEYGPQCIGYGMDTWSQGNYVSEDCLTLNVVRSTGSGSGLPVVVSSPKEPRPSKPHADMRDTGLDPWRWLLQRWIIRSQIQPVFHRTAGSSGWEPDRCGQYQLQACRVGISVRPGSSGFRAYCKRLS